MILILITLVFIGIVAYALLKAIDVMSMNEAKRIKINNLKDLYSFIHKSLRLYVINRESKKISRLKKRILNKLMYADDKEMAHYKMIETLINELSADVVGRKVTLIDTDVVESRMLGYYMVSKDKVFINALCIYKALEQRDSISNLNKFLNTCCHELRHAWQHDNKRYMHKYISAEADYKAYRNQPKEVDARRYAAVKVFFMSNKRKEDLLKKCLKVL